MATTGASSPTSGCLNPSQAPLWDELAACRLPLLLVAGADDAKFAALARQMAQGTQPPLPPSVATGPQADYIPSGGQGARHDETRAVAQAVGPAPGLPEIETRQPPVQLGVVQQLQRGGRALVVVPGCGHAVPTEAPLELADAVLAMLRSRVQDFGVCH